MMKGVILAGGLGTRLLPLTEVTNKCLLPIYDQPMIYYPINTLKNMGIDDILIILGGNSVGDVMNLLGDGSVFGVEFTYKIQKEPKGIAHGFKLAENFIGDDAVALILADNIFFDKNLYSEGEILPKIFLKEVKDPQRYGCVQFDDKKIINIIEKPDNPPSNYIATGLYIFSCDVFDIIKKLKPSGRGEYEIAEVIDYYIQNTDLNYKILQDEWIDAGTIDSLFNANEKMSRYIS